MVREPLFRRLSAGDHPEERRLTGTIGADDPDDPTARE